MSELRERKHIGDVLVFSCALVVAVASIVIGALMRGRSYVLVSFIVVICAIVPFFVQFERSRPSARLVAMIAVLCALAVASRAAFVWVPFFKPMAGIVMIGGMAFGRRSGFLIGALSMLASNFIFGQGPWTPWQMLSFGACGYVFGLLADRGAIPRSGFSIGQRFGVAFGGAAFVVLIAGPLLDTSSLFYVMSNVNLSSALFVYVAGFAPNCIQAAATFITLLLVANPILGMIHRLDVKYGIRASAPK